MILFLPTRKKKEAILVDCIQVDQVIQLWSKFENYFFILKGTLSPDHDIMIRRSHGYQENI